ncbi:hypothetical protein NPIL_319781 [Nephila pilipes]|uniref:Uncharacterized protein n=1 Tax=Nephila pilipes TaxID=299642 RepID=A0A8X6UD23_NEPPI|nr:hypothetical protein NPIL_319781 [Nephila pilipes]
MPGTICGREEVVLATGVYRERNEYSSSGKRRRVTGDMQPSFGTVEPGMLMETRQYDVMMSSLRSAPQPASLKIFVLIKDVFNTMFGVTHDLGARIYLYRLKVIRHMLQWIRYVLIWYCCD